MRHAVVLIVLIAFLALASPLALVAAVPPPFLPPEVLAAMAAEVSGTTAKGTVQELSRHHRQRGSRGFRAAAEHVRERLETYGLAGVEILELPADGEVFYGTQRSRPAWDADFAELWEQRRDDGAGEGAAGEGGEWTDAVRIASYAERPITLAQDSASGAVATELVDVGEGTSEEDYAGKEVAGKLVLAGAQPGPVARLAVERFGAAGIVSYAQNQRSAWWKQDETLVRWGHLDTFPPPSTFAFMVSLQQARAWRERLADGGTVRLRAEVRAGQHPGVYAIPTAVIPGADPAVAGEEIVYSCHLDHQLPGANDNASGCAAILEAARVLHRLIAAGTIPRPRRTLRFYWPPEIEGTLALLAADPERAARARAVIHMDMVGGDPAVTKAVFHLTRTPGSLPTIVNDLAEAFGRWMNAETDDHASGRDAAFPLVDPEGGEEAWLAQMVDFTPGSDHQVWTSGSYRVPALYLNDWPDRYIHTHKDGVANIDATKLLRAAFLGAASGYTLASLEDRHAGALVAAWRRGALARTAVTLERATQLSPRQSHDALALRSFRLRWERRALEALAAWVPLDEGPRQQAESTLHHLAGLLGVADSPPAPAPAAPAGAGAVVYRRRPEPRGTMGGFGYSYLEDRRTAAGLPAPRLPGASSLWADGYVLAYEALNLVDGERSVGRIRDDLAALYGPVELELVAEYLATLEAIGVLERNTPGAVAAP